MPLEFKSKTLGPISARLISELQKRGKTIFTLKEAYAIYKKNLGATSDLLSELVSRGVLARIKKGTYLILQTGLESTQLQNWPIIADALSSPLPYFISHYSALRLHGLTSHPLLDITITMPFRRQNKNISGLNYNFIYTHKKYFFGHTLIWVTKTSQTRVSDLERTILDGLDRPELCGGLSEIIAGIRLKQQEINTKKLLSYAKRWPRKAAIKRLGFLLEMFGFNDEKLIRELRSITLKVQGYSSLDTTSTKRGTYLNRWGLRLNTNLDELKK